MSDPEQVGWWRRWKARVNAAGVYRAWLPASRETVERLLKPPLQRAHTPSWKPPSPVRLIPLSFLALICVGCVLLALPWASADGHSMGLIDALFTSTTSVCVTGLVVRDTGSQLSIMGQAVVLLLLQMGGLGYMVLSTAAVTFLGQRLMVRDQLLIQQALGGFSLQGVTHLLRMAIAFTFTIEAVGALLLTGLFWARIPDIGLLKALAYGIFHSASAFCNAGLDLMGREFGPYVSLTPFVDFPGVNLVVMVLILLGGLGFTVLTDAVFYLRGKPAPTVRRPWIRHRLWVLLTAVPRRLSYHSRLVLNVTGWLLALGAVFILLFEWSNPHTLARLPLHQRLMAACFQSVTPRTAGFATLDYAQLQVPSLVITILLMFIGASPGGTGGGVKTTTAAVLIAAIAASLRGSSEAHLLQRRIPHEVVYRALTLAVLSVMLIGLALCAMSVTEYGLLHEGAAVGRHFLSLLFEVVSAFGTVGLSTGITPFLSQGGKLVLILLMFVGRVGPLTAALALLQSMRPGHKEYPAERVMIG